MISRAEALELFRSDDLIGIGMRADAIRRALHPAGVVSYAIAADAAATGHIATLTFSAHEPIEQALDRLEAIRQGDYVSFIPLTEDLTAVEYLKALAISRIFLENIPNVESSTIPQGLKTCQLGLRFGANDAGTIAAPHTEEDLRRIIRDAGFTPKQRDPLFTTYFLN